MSSQPKRQTSGVRIELPSDRLDHDAPDAVFLATLGQRVRTARAEQGLSRKALADLANVSERYLAQLEGGEGNASNILLRRVGRALGLRVSDLLNCDLLNNCYTVWIKASPAEHMARVLALGDTCAASRVWSRASRKPFATCVGNDAAIGRSSARSC